MKLHSPSRVLLSCSMIALFILLAGMPVYGDSTWNVGRPTSPTTYDYRNGSGGPVKVSNKYSGNDANSGVGAEVYRYSQNYLGGSAPYNDMYTLRIEAAGSSRIAHNYVIQGYGPNNNWNADCSKWAYCLDTGITTTNQGTWVDLRTAYYFWGRPYTQIFVCPNGWAAFVYNGGNDCGSVSRNLPQHHTVDASGFHDSPEGILAPLWKTYDLALNGRSGKVYVGYSYDPATWGRRCIATVSACAFSIIWSQVPTNGADCRGGPCLQSFDLVFWSNGLAFFDYASVDKVDGSEVIGMDDPTGYLSTIPDSNSSICGTTPCTHGGGRAVTFQDQSTYVSNAPWANFISDSKVAISSADNSWAYFVTDSSDPSSSPIQGFNIRTTNPPPGPNYASLLSDFADQLVVDGLCSVATPLGCIASRYGDVLANWICVQYLRDRCIYSLVKQLLPQPNPPKYSLTPWTSDTRYCASATKCSVVDAPVEENDLWCGPLLTKSCATDTGLFVAVQWIVPHDGAAHSLQIKYQVQSGGNLDGSGGPWDSTTVSLTVGPEDEFSLSSNCSSVNLPINTYYGNCNLTMNPGGRFYGPVYLSPSAHVSGTFPVPGTAPAGGFQLSTPAPIQTSLGIQTGGTPGVYTVSVTATSGIRSHTLSITVNVGSDFGISASPSSLNLTPGVSGSSTVTITSANGFSGTVNLAQSVAPSTGLICSLSPGAVTNSGTSNLSCSGNAGSYAVTITGTSGSISHSVQVSVGVSSGSSTVLSNNPSSSDWNILSGTWTQVSGYLDGNGSYPEIKSTAAFPADRTVTAAMRTISPGTSNWQVAWLRGKYIDTNNKAMMYLRTDGYLEIDVLRAGTACSSWCYYASTSSTGQSPTAWHTFQMVFAGNEIKGLLDSVVYIDITNSVFGTFGASNVVLYSQLNMESQWNGVTIATGSGSGTLSNNPSSPDWVAVCGCGSWSQVNGYIDGQNTWAELKSSMTFASDRTVTLRMVSITTGSQPYNTAWLRPKYIDNNNEIMLLIHADGVLELSIVYQGTQRALAQASTGLNPTAWHTFKTSIIGSTLNVWVDGTQYMTNIIDPSGQVSALGATSIALMNGGNTHSEFDSVTIG